MNMKERILGILASILYVSILWLADCSLAHADSCFQIDVSAWTARQKNHVVAASSELLSEESVQGFKVSQPFDGTQVCVTTQSVIPDGTLTTETILAKIQTFESTWQAEASMKSSLVSAIRSELTPHVLASMTFAQVTAWVDSKTTEIFNALNPSGITYAEYRTIATEISVDEISAIMKGN